MQVLLRGRVHTVRGKGKSCFIVLRQGSTTVQVSAAGGALAAAEDDESANRLS